MGTLENVAVLNMHSVLYSPIGSPPLQASEVHQTSQPALARNNCKLCCLSRQIGGGLWLGYTKHFARGCAALLLWELLLAEGVCRA